MPPLTSFDWNVIDPSIVITCSIDTTCTIWDVNTSHARTQLIAHDSEVYDVSFVASSVDVFASVGADGSIRVFDLRSLDHSTIIYESSKPTPLVRIAANPQDRNLLATLAADTNKIYILDVRVPGVPLATLQGHQNSVNSISWAPAGSALAKSSSASGATPISRSTLASAGDDCQVLLWDINVASSSTAFPIVSAYTDTTEVNNIAWNKSGEWLGVVSGKGIQGVKVQ